MAIVQSSISQFSDSSSLEYAYQSWKFSPKSPQNRVYETGGALPSPININIDVEDFYNGLFAAYDEYYIGIGILKSDLGPDVIAISGDWTEASLNLIDKNNLSASVNFSFNNNLQLYSPGDLYVLVRFSLYGKNTNGTATLLDFYKDFEINTKIIGSGYYYMSPEEINFSMLEGASLPPAQPVKIYASSQWFIKHSPKIIITGGNNFSTLPDGMMQTSGDGTTDLMVSIDPSVESVVDQKQTFFLTYQDGNLPEKFVTVNVLVHSSNLVSATPQTLYFFGVKNQVPPQPQTLNVVGFGNILAIGSGFLSLSKTNGTDFLETEVSVVGTQNMSIGTHQGKITVYGDNNELEILVVYEVVGLLSLNFPDTRLHFTKEQKELSVYSSSSNAYAQIILTVDTFDENQTANTNTYTFEVPIFQNKGRFKLGLELHRLFEEINLEKIADGPIGFGNYANPLRVRTDVSVFERDTRQFISNAHFFNSFVKGIRPQGFVKNFYGLLSYYNLPQRVTKSGRGIVNFADKQSSGQIEVVVNGNSYYYMSYSTGLNNLFYRLFKFDEFSPGDVVEVLVRNTVFVGGQTLRKVFYIMPEAAQSYHISWVNECNVVEMMQFTGGYAFNREYKNFEAETTNGFVETFKNLSVKKSLKVSCNTGFILQETVKVIDSLLSAEKCLLHLGDQNIELVSGTKKLEEIDTEKELYAYELEFKINPITDAEVYP